MFQFLFLHKEEDTGKEWECQGDGGARCDDHCRPALVTETPDLVNCNPSLSGTTILCLCRVLFILPFCNYTDHTRLVQVLSSVPLLLFVACHSSNAVDAVYGCVYGHVICNLPYSKVTSLLFVQLFAALW